MKTSRLISKSGKVVIVRDCDVTGAEQIGVVDTEWLIHVSGGWSFEVEMDAGGIEKLLETETNESVQLSGMPPFDDAQPALSKSLPAPPPMNKSALMRDKVHDPNRKVDSVQDRKIAAVLSWAEGSADAEKFDTAFVESLADGIEKYKSLTPKQEAALDKIIEKFEIDIEEWS